MSRHRKEWTEDEVEKLLFHAPIRSFEQLAEDFGRNPIGVYRKWNQVRDNSYIGMGGISQRLGIPTRTALRWLRQKHFGNYYVIHCPGRGRKNTTRVIPEGRLVEFVQDPYYRFFEWVPEEIADEDLQRLAQDIVQCYVYVNEMAKPMYLQPTSVQKYVQRDYLPVLRIPCYGGHKNIVPKPVAELWVQCYNDGMMPQDIAPLSWKKAKEIEGFDSDVAASWREPWYIQE